MLLKKLSNIICNHLFLFIAVFGIVFASLTLPFGYWGFVGDDYGNILHSQLQSWSDFIKLFYEGDACSFYQASNYVPSEPNFFSVYYRPMAFVFTYIQSIFFGFNPYGYFLIFILFHAINAALIFNIFSWFIPLGWAFLMALFFAFHISLGSWFGWLPAFQQIINLTLLLLILILLKQYLKTREIFYYVGAVFLFLVSLFNRETFLVFPFLLTLGVIIFRDKAETLCHSVFRAIKISACFWLAFSVYFYTRLYFFPIKFVHSGLCFHDGVISVSNRFLEAVSFLSDLFGLSFMPAGHRLCKGVLIISIFTLIFTLFLKNEQIKRLSFLAFSLLAFMWPAFLTHYLPRSLYESALFLFCLILIFLFKYSTIDCFGFQIVKKFIFGLGVFMCAFFMIKSMKTSEQLILKINTAFAELCLNKSIINKPLCFVELPCSFIATGVAQAVWMRGVNKGLPIFELQLPIKVFKEEWNKIIPMHKRFVNIEVVNTGLRAVACLPNVLCFDVTPGAQNILINKTVRGNVVDVFLPLSDKWPMDRLVFIGWDYDAFKFKILNGV
ncbi:MAG: hypothetical protein US49_C0002G0079 [candidate division TM6 bacterium GW2011_GWF2_37_49]|nr:MAG: hypothetical protein US49_C0002G0079 [candidate division TM6 bacterium GW2011_GWF2_37_49]